MYGDYRATRRPNQFSFRDQDRVSERSLLRLISEDILIQGRARKMTEFYFHWHHPLAITCLVLLLFSTLVIWLKSVVPIYQVWIILYLKSHSSADIKIPIGFHSLWVDLRSDEEKAEDSEDPEDSSGMRSLFSLIFVAVLTLWWWDKNILRPCLLLNV